MYNFKSITIHKVDKTAYLDKIFAYIPVNAFINKGRCGIGATTLEIKNASRCSIIVSPTVGILKDKVKSHPELFIVYADVSYDEVKDQLALRLPSQKIMTTPEGIKKVINAAQELVILGELHTKWFLMLDECHTFINEDYRKHILRPFDYFWDFENKAILSATPYYFSDERFNTLDYHKIEFTDTLGTITLVDSKSVPATLDYLIKESADQDGQLHVFLNSVTETERTIRRLGLTDLTINCADDKDKANMAKLGDLQQYFVEQPDKSNFKKVNFYTSRYFEGWDMFDDNATIVLVTDIYCPHTKLSISMKLKQAAGRLRNPVAQIIHITNHHNNNLHTPKSLQSLKEEYFADATILLSQYEVYLAHCKVTGKKPESDPRLEKYADFRYKTKVASLNKMKIDQQINQAYSHEMYNNLFLIKEEWEKGYYDVEIMHCNRLLETKTTMKRKSKSAQLKEDYLAILDDNKQTDTIIYKFGSVADRKKITNPLAYQAATLIDEQTMNRLQYNVKKVQAEVITVSNTRTEVKLLQLLNQEFKQGLSYTNAHIINKLLEIYTMLDIRDPKTGELIKPIATQLRTPGWFDIEKCKLPDEEGKYTLHGYRILRAQFNLRVAA